jgi:hypothetical protein
VHQSYAGSDDPTKSYRIPGDGFTPDSVRQIYQMFQILRAVVLAILENTLFDASDPIGILSDCRILYDPKIGSDNRIDRPGIYNEKQTV